MFYFGQSSGEGGSAERVTSMVMSLYISVERAIDLVLEILNHTNWNGAASRCPSAYRSMLTLRNAL